MNYETESKLNKYNDLKELVNIASNPVTKAGIKMIPKIGELFSDITIQNFEILREQSLEDFMLEIKNDDSITLEEIDKIGVFNRFINMYRCISKGTNNDKIKYFKNLLKSNIKDVCSNNETDEFSETLDRMSMKDIKVLVMLYNYMKENNFSLKTELIEYDVQWKSLIESYDEGEEMFLSYCRRLSGFGFCREFVGYSDYIGGAFILTEYGNKFIKSIINE